MLKMLHLLLSFLFLAIFLIPKTETLAQEACVEMVCPDGTQKVSGTQCAASQTSNRVAPITPMCAAGKNPSNPADVSRCICNPIGPGTGAPAPGAAGGATAATPPEACVEMVCPNGTIKVSATQCAAGLTSSRVDPITPMCPSGKMPSNPADVSSCVCNPIVGTPPPTPPPLDCSQPGVCTSGKGKSCNSSSGAPADDGDGILTAIGCIPTEPMALVNGLLRYGTLAAGGIAFLLMILGALQMITAEGNPESIKHGQERFYSAIIGLLLVIFSVLLMQVIGVDILGLPGFGRQ